MNNYALSMVAVTSVLALSMPVAMGHAGNTLALSDDTHGISIDNGDVIIHNNEGGKARITPSGTLIIGNETMTVNVQQRDLLRDYVSTVKDIEIKGVQLGEAATGFATSIVAEVLSGVFTGEDEDKIDKQTNARAQTFKLKALPICKDVQDLKEIQDSLTASIVAFQPYAVIKDTDAHECEQDIISDD